MELLSKVGFTNNNKEVLQWANINNAKIVNMEDQIGSIEKGKFADLTILKEKPLSDLKAYTNPPFNHANAQCIDMLTCLIFRAVINY